MQPIFENIQKLASFLYIKDIIDISIIAIAVYLILIFIKQTRSFLIFGSFITLFGLNYIAQQFNLTLTRQLFEPLLTFFIAVLVIVFQPEIRKFFKWVSSNRKTSFKKALALPENNIQTIVRSVFQMAKQKTGAIIVIPGEYPLDDLLEGGFPLNGKITFPLILSIFDSSSPGHDGAVLIDGSEIKMFGLHLPLAREFTEYSRVGTRHRAAAGITERTDAMSIIVSEERGEVSISTKGKLQKVATPEELADIISKFTGDDKKPVKGKKGWFHFVFVKHAIYKLASILVAATMWFLVVYQAGISKMDYSIPIEYRAVSSNLEIRNSLPDSITISVTGNNRDIANMDKANIRVVIDASQLKAGDNRVEIQKSDIQTPSYIEVNSFTPRSVTIRTVDKETQPQQ